MSLSIAATKIDDQPTFFIAHLVLKAIYHEQVNSEKCFYEQSDTSFVERK
jgi:hypothetical protein